MKIEVTQTIENGALSETHAASAEVPESQFSVEAVYHVEAVYQTARALFESFLPPLVDAGEAQEEQPQHTQAPPIAGGGPIRKNQPGGAGAKPAEFAGSRGVTEAR